uniref:Uncharacterized protein n=1 Tax=Avena sativa TaxID=4498 RepID=A0ACD5WIP7_AVESA
MSSSSSVSKRPKKKTASTVAPSSLMRPPPAAVAPLTLVPEGTLPLVPCPCCRFRRTIRLVSQSETNPGRVFYKYPNHRINPNPCNHYYWQDGEDSYVDFLSRNGYYAFDSVADVASQVTEEVEELGLKKMDYLVQKMEHVVKKMDELINICRNVFAAMMFLIVVLVYVAIAK